MAEKIKKANRVLMLLYRLSLGERVRRESVCVPRNGICGKYGRS